MELYEMELPNDLRSQMRAATKVQVLAALKPLRTLHCARGSCASSSGASHAAPPHVTYGGPQMLCRCNAAESRVTEAEGLPEAANSAAGARQHAGGCRLRQRRRRHAGATMLVAMVKDCCFARVVAPFEPDSRMMGKPFLGRKVSLLAAG